MGYHEHQQRARVEGSEPIRCGILTLSDTRTFETDTSGAVILAALTQAGHDVVRYEVVRDEPAQIVELVRALVSEGCKLIITNGGTGIARRDSTIEAIDSLLEKRLPGFGELFRMISYDDIGPGAMLSRAIAGTYLGALLFCLPGSTGAVRLALEKLIMPELSHLVWETVRQ
ncbi:molybdenum cofactor biosynthesis protein MoaB [Oscillochloris sp. ZM17-4]|uniref:MogA/MoaB family molybdenum cofactor biosynthesis protein n=1 Tax=Oscillochloris sp. ZM17-4 TaxID=2866714 RepID=UPI001C72A392|nr:molybdenum cofactor biosynthesis protein B [Oscillochloris sp. ZM17-4]MBX0327428.1 molybdenum cofactor biosynthesis protein MoaB [Oscillochloris sp. ZM17-4]